MGAHIHSASRRGTLTFQRGTGQSIMIPARRTRPRVLLE